MLVYDDTNETMKELIDCPNNANPKMVTAGTSFLCKYDYHKKEQTHKRRIQRQTTRLMDQFLTIVLSTKANHKTKG